MTLPELAAMQQTFDLLQPLKPRERRRALKWLKAALRTAGAEPQTKPETDTTVGVSADETGQTPPATTATGAENEADAPVAADTAVAVGKVSAGSADNAGEVPAATQGSPDAAPTARRRARATKAASKVAPSRPAKKAAVPSETKAAPPAPDTQNGRQGKPSAEEIMKVYQAVGGTLTGVAEHYGKPYATVSGWARSLRDEGYQIGRARKA